MTVVVRKSPVADHWPQPQSDDENKANHKAKRNNNVISDDYTTLLYIVLIPSIAFACLCFNCCLSINPSALCCRRRRNNNNNNQEEEEEEEEPE